MDGSGFKSHRAADLYSYTEGEDMPVREFGEIAIDLRSDDGSMDLLGGYSYERLILRKIISIQIENTTKTINII